ncbi:MAG: adenosylcobalamin-dependent ribonucleoside-diphosphate reductase [Sulfolobales archaeon]|nr:adenosylcobalamin-dependent ribonucleoside-diphosphate reductase [Sulfolobales archaeon]MCX8186366.1 adenosylcobalamin-dependent ribonucleoside-diphosphate reductase [Sulfolobales archaeon]MDW7968899.1 adenosylcobalamin-dependent ribonucleoside-diphosphate reductase [Sulfolobales archaeon]
MGITSLASQVKVLKKDGRVENLSVFKVRESLVKALSGVALDSYIDEILDEVLEGIKGRESVTTKYISDIVEKAFSSRIVSDISFELAARRYVLARIYNDVYGKGKWSSFDGDDLKFTFQALKVLESRYLLKDPRTLRYLETPKMLFMRVAEHIASNEDGGRQFYTEKFFDLMISRKFMPNSPTLMNSKTKLGLLSACFVLPVRDSLTTAESDGIMDSLRASALIHQQGGGTGYSFSELRPEGDVVASTAGVASGPVSFMKMYDAATEVIKQGGRRRGANMGVLHVWHPDILKFIRSKSGELKDVNLQNFNISVGVYDSFMRAVEEGSLWALINPRQTSLNPNVNDSRNYAVVWARYYMNEEWVQEYIIDELESSGGSIPLDRSLIITYDELIEIARKENAIVSMLSAVEIFNEIIRCAWESGDPGLLFIDTINRRHPVWYLGKINATNPCGEVPAREWESCNLGSINLELYVGTRNGRPTILWDELAEDVKLCVRFLDNVIDLNKYPLPQIERETKRSRKIGLGVMGWAHMLVKLNIPYNSVDALYLAYYISEWIQYNAYLSSMELAKERGPFPAWDPKLYKPVWFDVKQLEEILKIGGISGISPSEQVRYILAERPNVNWDLLKEDMLRYGIRNATVTSIAPTGTISIIAGTSSSIEPLFALAFVRQVSVGTFIEVNQLFLEYLRQVGLDEPEVIKTIANSGSIMHNPFIPKTLRRIFVTAHDIEPIWHLLHQAVWQQWTDQGVSKTINMRAEATIDDVRNVYLTAWKLGCKGITVYRDKSKTRQVIQFGLKIAERLAKEEVERELGKSFREAEELTEVSKQEDKRAVRDRFRTQKPPMLREGEAGDCRSCEY